MRLPTLALLLALLAGCATPAEIRRDGVREDFALTLPADKAVTCVRRNAEDYSGAFSVIAHEREVIVRGADTTVAVAEIRPSGARSAATIWRKSPTFGISDLPAAMAKGC
jgi:hypothetical protein